MKTKLFSLALATFIGTSSGAFAISAIEKQIDSHLIAPLTIKTDTAQHVVNAAKATLLDPGFTGKTSSIVKVALPYCASFAPDLVNSALAHIVADTTDFDPLNAQLHKVAIVQATAIVKAGMSEILAGSSKEKSGGSTSIFSTGVNDKSDGAARLTYFAVDKVKGNSDLLQAVVMTAVKTAQSKGSGLTNGAAGATTGAIADVAGTSNTSITAHSGVADSAADALVGNVILAATKAAPKRVSDIALAVGYAFAGTYRATTPSGQITAAAFLAASQAGLDAAIEAAFNAKTAAKLHAAILQQISSGVALAYAGFEGPGQAGVKDFAFNNGSGTPVTDVLGL